LRTTLLMGVLAAVALATWLYSRPPAESGLGPRAGGSSAPLGYYVLGARLLGTDAEGRVTYRLSADRLEEMPADDSLTLAGVRVEYAPPDAAPWLIRATAAVSPKDGSSLDLKGGVELRSDPPGETSPTVITTDSLRFSPDTSSAESDGPVSIHVGDWHLDATGFSTHLKADTLRLESDVHGKFGP
jgi:lipopolysaccharide export system protein LptC